NQYHVVMEVEPQFWQNPEGLKYIYVPVGNTSPTNASDAAASAASNTSLGISAATSSAPVANTAAGHASGTSSSTNTSNTSSTSSTTNATGASSAAASGTPATPSATSATSTASSVGKLVPLAAFTHYESTNAPLTVNHQGQFPAITFSFNLPPGVALGDAVKAVNQAEAEIRLPESIHGSFAGTAQAF